MRVIAISLVFILHLLLNFIAEDLWFFWYLAYLGVEIFFVLSGFLIGTILLQSVDPISGRLLFKDLKRFLIRRWLRTVPLYYFVLFVNFLVGYFLLNSGNKFDIQYLFWLQNLTQNPPDFLGESWSLSIEEWFYLLFAIGFFLFLTSAKRKWRYSALLYTSLFIFFGILVRSMTPQVKPTEFKIVITRLDAIAYGVLFAVLNHLGYQAIFNKYTRCLVVAGLIFILIAICIFLGKSPIIIPHLAYYPFIGIGLSCVLIALKEYRGNHLKPSFRHLIQAYSKISYSVYLNNLLVILLVKHYVNLQPAVQAVIAMVLTIFLSRITYIYIEKYFIQLRERLVP